MSLRVFTPLDAIWVKAVGAWWSAQDLTPNPCQWTMGCTRDADTARFGVGGLYPDWTPRRLYVCSMCDPEVRTRSWNKGLSLQETGLFYKHPPGYGPSEGYVCDYTDEQIADLEMYHAIMDS